MFLSALTSIMLQSAPSVAVQVPSQGQIVAKRRTKRRKKRRNRRRARTKAKSQAEVKAAPTTAKVKESYVFKIDGMAFGLKRNIALCKKCPLFVDPLVFTLNDSTGSPVLIAHFGVSKTSTDLGTLVF
mgnify:CR=1 FL=1